MNDLITYSLIGLVAVLLIRISYLKWSNKKKQVKIDDLETKVSGLIWAMELKDTKGKAHEEIISDPNGVRERMHNNGWIDTSTKK